MPCTTVTLQGEQPSQPDPDPDPDPDPSPPPQPPSDDGGIPTTALLAGAGVAAALLLSQQ
jgi:hypothetical protein